MLRHPALSAAVLLACLLLPCRPAHAQAPSDVVRPIRGKLLDTAGRPVPDIRLFLPGWDGGTKSALAQNTVTTRADGTFVWKNLGYPYSEMAVVPDVQVLPVNHLWQIVAAPVSDQDSTGDKIRDRFQPLIKPVQAHWINNLGGVNVETSPDTGTLIVEMPPTGMVKIHLRGPDGKRYPNHVVQLWPLDDWGYGSEAFYWKGRTDTHGDVLLPQFELDLDRVHPKPLRVVLPGIGYNTTGIITVYPGETKSIDLPPLAPFATVTGTVPAALRKPGQVVRLSRKPEENSNAPWSWRQAHVDANGRWTLPDVTSGTQSLYLFDSEAAARKDDLPPRYRASATFNVSGGRAPENIVLRPLPVLPPFHPAPPVPRVAAVLVGHVRNADGTNADNTDVWGLYSVETGHGRAFTTTLHAKTNADGLYRLTGVSFSRGDALVGRRAGTFVFLLATRPDAAPALAAVTVNREEVHTPDLQFSRDEATLVVTVLDTAGEPAADVPVEAQASIFQYLLDARDWHDDAFKDLLHAFPTQATTDSNGTVRFAHLRPDVYRINASRPLPPPTPSFNAHGIGSSYATAEGIAVSAGQDVKQTMRLLPVRPHLQARYVAPDGTIVRSQSFSYSTRAAGGDRQQVSGGISTYPGMSDHFDVDLPPGVWDIEYVGDARLKGRATVAVRSNDARERTLDIHLAPQDATRLNLQLLDERGHPVAGTVYKADYSQSFSSDPQTVGTSDKQGCLTLTLDTKDASEIASLRAEANGDAPFPTITTPNTPLPSDATLTNRRRWPVKAVTFEIGKTTPIRLQAVRVGWVRGYVKTAPQGYLGSLWSEEHTWGTQLRYEPRTGEYLIGPLPPGPFTLSFTGKTGSKQETVTVAPGQVLHHDITLGPTLADEQVQLEYEGERLAQTAITVVDDQNHPVPGAFACLQGPFYGRTGATRLSDSQGQASPYFVPWITQRALPYEYSSTSQPLPKNAFWMGYVPGSRGIAIVSALPGGPNAPIRLTLPPPINVRGTVTIGGKPLSRASGQFVVYARAEDDTPQGLIRSIATQPSADGTYSLQGLTPGRYVVQAMLDHTFLSLPQSLTVSDAVLPALPLDIPAPGAPTVLDLGISNTLGRVYPAEPIAGPLADKFATRYWSADGAGIVHLEGLTAGTHKLRLPSGEIRSVVILPEKETQAP